MTDFLSFCLSVSHNYKKNTLKWSLSCCSYFQITFANMEMTLKVFLLKAYGLFFVLCSQANTLCPAPSNKPINDKVKRKKTRKRGKKIPSVWILMRLHKLQLCLSQLQRWNHEIRPKWLGRRQRELFISTTAGREGWREKQAECLRIRAHLYTRHGLDCFWNPTKSKISQQMPHSHRLPVIFTEGKGQVDSSIPAQLPPVTGNLIFIMCTSAQL